MGHTILEVFPQTEPHWIETYGEVALTGKSIQIENYASALNKWYEVRAYCPKHGQFAVTFSDITRRKKAEKQLEIAAKFPAQNPNPVLTNFTYRTDLIRQFLQRFVAYPTGKPVRMNGCRMNGKPALRRFLPGKLRRKLILSVATIIYSCNFVPILDEDYVNVYGRDATQRKRAEQEINNLKCSSGTAGSG